MVMGKWFLSAAMVLVSGSMLIAADEPAAPTTQPAATKPAKPKKLTQPWSLLKTLTPDQVTQIEKIHSDAYEQTRKIDAKENDDIKALLSPDQLKELAAAVEAKHKEESAKRRREAAAATQP